MSACKRCGGRGWVQERWTDSDGEVQSEVYDCHACSGCCAVTA